MKKISTWVVLGSLIAVVCFLQDPVWAAEKKGVSRDHMYSVCFFTDKEGWAVGARGAVFHSSDGGVNWEKQTVKTLDPLFSVSFCNPQVGWVVGKSGTIFHTVDGGKTWNAQSPPKKRHLFTVEALSPEKCWAAGDWGTVLYTEDGGKTWVDRTYPKDMTIYDIEFQGDKEGWMAGEFGTILHTQDGGKKWEPQKTGIESTLFSVSFTSKKEGVSVGLGGKILRTENGGQTWLQVGKQDQPAEPSDQPASAGKLLEERRQEQVQSLYEVKLRGKLGIAAGDAGRILTTDDGGRTWNPIPLPMDMNLFWFRGVSLVDDHGAIIGARSIIVLTNGIKMKALGFLPKIQPPGK